MPNFENTLQSRSVYRIILHLKRILSREPELKNCLSFIQKIAYFYGDFYQKKYPEKSRKITQKKIKNNHSYFIKKIGENIDLKIDSKNENIPLIKPEKFSDFVHTVLKERKLIIGEFHKILSQELELFTHEVKMGKNPRIMILAPPQHGKSEIVSRLYPAWILGNDDEIKIISCSYSQALASRMNAAVQEIIQSPSYQSIFPKRFSQKTKSFIQIEGSNASYWCAGAGGSITGFSADIAIIDDPLKDFKQAHSEKRREDLWHWFTSTLSTRLSPRSGIILAMTRWHKDDLAGRILELIEQGVEENWKVLKFPALSTESDMFRPKAGEPLFPERYNAEWLNNKRRSVGNLVWENMYQQNPQDSFQNPIRNDWFKRYIDLPSLAYLAIFSDTALKTGRQHDYSVFQIWGKGTDGDIYFIDQIRGKWEAFELRRQGRSFYQRWAERSYDLPNKPKLRGMYVEDSASGTHLIQEMKREDKIPIFPIRHTKDKVTRFYDIQGYIESGYVQIPQTGHFVGEFLRECSEFNIQMTHAHDDQIDPMVDAISLMLAKPGSNAAAKHAPQAAAQRAPTLLRPSLRKKGGTLTDQASVHQYLLSKTSERYQTHHPSFL